MDEAFIFTAAGSRARRHLERTIATTVPVDEIRRYDRSVAAALADVGYRDVRCWGSQPGASNRRSWDHMQPGHRGLLYEGAGHFPLVLTVIHKARSRELAERLWGRDDDGTWEFMFFFGPATQVDLTVERVRASLGYDSKWWPQGLQYPTPERQELLLEKFGTMDAFVRSSASSPAAAPDGKPDPYEVLLGRPFRRSSRRRPRQRRYRSDYDPDQTGRGYLAHEHTVEELASYVGATFHDGRPGINHDGGWMVDGGFHIAEVKSITAKNEVPQLEKGLGQLLHNRHKAHRVGLQISGTYLIAEREPTNSELWRELCAEVGIVFTWPARFREDIRSP